MMNTMIVKRYVTALFELGLQQKKLEQIEHDITGLAHLYQEIEMFQTICKTSLFSIKQKMETFKQISKILKISSLTEHFLLVLVQNGRAEYLESCLHAFKARLQEHNGILTVNIISAIPLDKAQKDKIHRSIENSVKSAIEVKTEINPKLLGGFIVKTGSQVYDASIKTKLEDLRTLMKEA